MIYESGKLMMHKIIYIHNSDYQSKNYVNDFTKQKRVIKI